MSKIKCICGNIIIDQTDDLRFKANFVRDQNLEKFFDAINVVGSYIDAVEKGKKEVWQNEFYETKMEILKNSEIVNDILSRFRVGFESVMYQCENCERLHIQLGNSNKFVLFKPEEPIGKEILKGI
jgi:hypothetical protein